MTGIVFAPRGQSKDSERAACKAVPHRLLNFGVAHQRRPGPHGGRRKSRKKSRKSTSSNPKKSKGSAGQRHTTTPNGRGASVDADGESKLEGASEDGGSHSHSDSAEPESDSQPDDDRRRGKPRPGPETPLAKRVRGTGVGSSHIIKWLKEVVLPNTPRPLTIVWDNVRTHTSQEMEDFIASLDDDVTLLPLPPYSPFLNPVEYYFGFVKRAVRQRKIFTEVELRDAVNDAVHSVRFRHLKAFWRRSKSYHGLCLKRGILTGTTLHPRLCDREGSAVDGAVREHFSTDQTQSEASPPHDDSDCGEWEHESDRGSDSDASDEERSGSHGSASTRSSRLGHPEPGSKSGAPADGSHSGDREATTQAHSANSSVVEPEGSQPSAPATEPSQSEELKLVGTKRRKIESQGSG